MEDMMIVAGPCSAESRAQVVETAQAVALAGATLFRAGVWKPRTKPGGFEGLGEKALPWLIEAQELSGIPSATEVATGWHLKTAIEAGLRWLWIGARTATNPFAMQELADEIASLPADIRNQLNIMVKNPVNPDLELWIGALQRVQQAGAGRVIAVHRGFSSYGSKLYRNEPRWAIPIELKRRMPDITILSDPSHIGGRRQLIAPLARQAADIGFDGLMIETHPSPDNALSDADQQITPPQLAEILSTLTPKRDEGCGENLDELRRRIDYIDDELIDLLAKRMEVSREIGRYKRQHGMPVVQPERYNLLMQKRVEEASALGITPVFTRQLLALIHEESVKQQIQP